VPKLIRGYHKCTVDEAMKLAAYIFRVKYKDDKSKLQHIPCVFSYLSDLVYCFSTSFICIKQHCWYHHLQSVIEINHYSVLSVNDVSK